MHLVAIKIVRRREMNENDPKQAEHLESEGTKISGRGASALTFPQSKFSPLFPTRI